MNKLQLVALFLIVLVFVPIVLATDLGIVAASDDWPMTQHDPQHTGHSESTVIQSPQLIWQLAVDTIEVPVLANGCLYFFQYSQGYYLCCVDAADGRLIWNHSSTNADNLAVYDNKLYTRYGIYSAENGDLIQDFSSVYQYDYPPVIADGIVYITNTDFFHYLLMAFNASSGKQLWNYSAPTPASFGFPTYSAAPIVTNGLVCFSDNNRTLHALNASTGIEVWNRASFISPLSTIICSGNYLYTGGYLNSELVFWCLDAFTGVAVWSFPMSQQLFRCPVIADGLFFVEEYALNASTGVLVWNNTQISGSPSRVVAGGVLYTTNYPGSNSQHNLEVNGFNASNGEKLWNYTFTGTTNTQEGYQLSVAYNKLYVCALDGIYVFGTPTPSPSIEIAAIEVSTVIIAILVAILAVAVWKYGKQKQPKLK